MPDTKPTLLLVDDEPANITVLMHLLKKDYRLTAARNGLEALERVKSQPMPDLVLLDIMMPGMDGYEVCQRLKADETTRDIPVIFITAMGEESDQTQGLALGAVDYITKPISTAIVLARVKTHLTLKQAREALANQNQILEERVKGRTKELAMAKDTTILAMATLAETRDNETGNHIRRTQYYVKALAEELRKQSNFAPLLTDDYIEQLYKSAPLHDIGKVGIRDSILLKPGKLTEDEFEEMKNHAVYGRDAIIEAEKLQGNPDSSFLLIAREIAYSHHKKWDGSGYPNSLSGQEIPFSGRLMAVADVYDALISKRVYKPAFSHEKASDIIRQGRGSHFDPEVVDAFERINDEFHSIARKFSD
ncbi:MAG: two-component system response regulator [endosymbiont of Seepiophila jonesi]|uniref:Two-component system response regulator n=1 Tax=endosymbiont of Lamellibrachia luymesi TaxID=2200907 RepID=A0A370DE53_9GAMM|nr:MAG: two-component system response regulator [endosymbiont of Lamellibrachia luymesi]RDH94633.1 MAG: two-component system response regulator [endosymbiont of Seepiophila jonesi]